MDEEKRKTLQSLGWPSEMLDALKPTAENAAVDEIFLDRSQRALSEAGSTVLELLAASPRISMVELAKRLDRGASAIGLIMAAYGEASSQGLVRQLAKDLLIRELLEQFPEGWTQQGNVHPLVRIGRWHSEVTNYARNARFAEYADRVIRSLAIDSPPPNGWKPEWPNDRLIEDLFDRCWPAERS